MASYTTSLRLVQPATGEFSGTWGTQVNNGLTALVDASVAGTATIVMTGADYTLSNNNGAADEARAAVLNLTGTPGAARNIIVPAVSKLYVVFNNTTGGFAQTVKTSAGTGVSVPNGAAAYLRCDGTNVVAAVNYFGSLTLGAALPVGSGGTGAATFTANNVLLGNGTSAFQVVAPGANGNVLTSNGTTWVSSSVSASVSSISFGSTGLTPSTATSGAVSVAGTLSAANGGTGLTSPGANGNVLTSNGTAWVSSTFTGSTNFQEFTSSGTWTKPAGAQFVMVELGGAGGGGGSGARANQNTSGGAAGGGGALTRYMFKASDLSATVSVTIGAGGAGGAAQTTNSSWGLDGSQGGNTTFGSYLTAFGGGQGQGARIGGSSTGGGGGGSGGAGSTSNGGTPQSDAFGRTTAAYKDSVGGGGGGPGFQGTGGNAEFGGGGGGAGNNPSTGWSGGSSIFSAGGGGSGGGIEYGVASASGAAGGATGSYNTGGGGSGGSGGAGVAGTQSASRGSGAGGGGGASSQTTAGGAGGAGGQGGGGGGGGGSSVNGFNSGAGGTGGAGYARIYTW